LKHLTLADEIVVLMLRDDTGAIRPARAASANIAIAGGLLMELSLLGRIDTDLTSLFIVDPNPVGDELLDQVLREIAAEPVKRSSVWWINQFGVHGGDLSGRVLGRLVEAGILREEDRQFLWVLSRRAYPKNSGREEREAKTRLMSVIFDDVVPTPRDTLLLSLADSAGVLEDMFSSEEMDKASTRIAQVVALEEIGRSVRAVESNRRWPPGEVIVTGV
jgi:Golgi phosphoprotein 3 (GPP34)